MFRTEFSVEMLKTIAIIVGFAVVLWSLGVHGLVIANASDLTTLRDVVSDSAPSAAADHTFTFATPSGIAAGETIVIDFAATGFDPSALDFGDIDLASSSEIALAAAPSGDTWGVSTDATSITFTSGTGVIDPGDTLTIKVGLNATFAVAGDTQIVNPSAEGAYQINISAGSADNGTLYVAILSSVDVTAHVDRTFTFSFSEVAAGSTVNGEPVTGNSSSTTIPFGLLTANTPTTTAHQLSIATNAPNGYVVTIQLDGALRSAAGNDIDGFANGSDSNTPSAWVAPTGIAGSENTFGHWGFTTDDATTTRSAANEFGPQEFAAASTTPRVVMSNDGPANGTGRGIGTTTVGYKVELSSMQEAGDYTAILTYVITPMF